MNKTDGSVAEVLKLLDGIERDLDRYSAAHRALLNGEIYLTDKELAERLRVSRRTLQQYRHLGEIPYYLICGKILYKESEIEKYIRDNYNGTVAEMTL